MTTERDDNIRYGDKPPDYMKGMLEREPVSLFIPLKQELLNQQNRFASGKVNKRDYIMQLLALKERLNYQENLMNQTMFVFSSQELKERTSLTASSIRQQSIVIKDIVYAQENRDLLHTVKTHFSLNEAEERFDIFRMQAEEAINFLTEAPLTKRRVADLFNDMSLLYHWTFQEQPSLARRATVGVEVAVEWWLKTLSKTTHYQTCGTCQVNSFKQLSFCIHCLNQM
ncbi:hypothetical protein [Pontibacillus salipaludis]|uniref:hypothetical protein n=1 Tax=Pontibacillus salipaludis TaxID=1697394 RepID=UPI0031F1C3FE